MTSPSADPSLRYDVDRPRLGPELGPRFVELGPDAETRAFVEAARARPHGRAAMLARSALTRFVSDFDANGLLGIHSMHLLSTDAARRLLGPGGRVLLDVGAGDGSVTAALAPLVERVVTTELSAPMARRLRARGYECHRVDLATDPLPADGPFDRIAALNVLDRCARPLSLLERLARLLEPAGKLVVAVPLPLAPHVHVGAATVDPDELLEPEGESFEAQARWLHDRAFAPVGLRVLAIARAPYLCRGSEARPLIALDDVIFVLERA